MLHADNISSFKESSRFETSRVALVGDTLTVTVEGHASLVRGGLRVMHLLFTRRRPIEDMRTNDRYGNRVSGDQVSVGWGQVRAFPSACVSREDLALLLHLLLIT